MFKFLSPPSEPYTTEQTICTGCIHDGDCVFQRNSATPILFCEEREVERKLEPVRAFATNGIHASVIPGLCGSCVHAENCALRDPERITYHCEHFE